MTEDVLFTYKELSTACQIEKLRAENLLLKQILEQILEIKLIPRLDD